MSDYVVTPFCPHRCVAYGHMYESHATCRQFIRGSPKAYLHQGNPGKPLATELINQDCLLSQHLGNMSKAWLRYCGDVIQYTRYSQ